jgi:hypothetical protein
MVCRGFFLLFPFFLSLPLLISASYIGCVGVLAEKHIRLESRPVAVAQLLKSCTASWLYESREVLFCPATSSIIPIEMARKHPLSVTLSFDLTGTSLNGVKQAKDKYSLSACGKALPASFS